MESAPLPSRTDIAIVGGGPAGLATALFLLHARPDLAARVVVLEKARYPREKVCAGAIGARADVRLAEIGVSVEVPSAPFDAMVVTTGAGVARRRFAGRTGPVPASGAGAVGRVVRRFEFDHALAEVARARGVAVCSGAGVVGLLRCVDGFELLLEGGRSLRARIVVGADGVGSLVRRFLELPRSELRAQAVEVDTPPLASDAERNALHFDLSDRALLGYSWDFPTPLAGREMVSRGVYQVVEPGSGNQRPDVSALLDARLRRLGLSPRDFPKRRFAERGLVARGVCAAPGVILVGEAAGIDALTGEGIAQAIEGGALAGRYLASVPATGVPDFADWTRRLQTAPLGVDLAVRRGLLAAWRGPMRPLLERALVLNPRVMDFTMGVFGGLLPALPRELLRRGARSPGEDVRHRDGPPRIQPR